MVGSIGSGHSFSALAASRALASPVDAAQAPAGAGQASGARGKELTDAEEKQVRELKQRDREVRAHEQAHARVGGSYASAPTYEFQAGPDGKKYAVGGEVQIDSAPIPGKPEATIRKLDIVIRAALAPAEPSSQDLQVAQKARDDKIKAQAELRAQKQAELNGDDSDAVGPAKDEANDTNGLLSLLQAQESAQRDLAASPKEQAETLPAASPVQSGVVDAIRAYQDRLVQPASTRSQDIRDRVLSSPLLLQTADSDDRLARIA